MIGYKGASNSEEIQGCLKHHPWNENAGRKEKEEKEEKEEEKVDEEEGSWLGTKLVFPV